MGRGTSSGPRTSSPGPPPRGSTRGRVRPRFRLVWAVALSLLIHASALAVMLQGPAREGAVVPRLTLVELTDVGDLSGPSEGDEAKGALGPAEPREAQEGSGQAESGSAQGAAEQAARVAALEAAHATLTERVESLAEERSDLSARLEAERQRATRLEQELGQALAARRRELAALRATHDQLVAALQREIADKEIALHTAEERLTVRIVDRVLFPSGQAGLTHEGRRLMAKVGPILATATDRRILIEGHTDNVPIGPGLRATYPTNWELSTARATEVVKYLIAHGKLVPERLSAAGRADTMPIASNANDDGRRLNRRIEIILLPPADPSEGGAPS
jgi:chemotaxis protein MotB